MFKKDDILKVWCKVLQKDNIDYDCNFFDAGGTSLLVYQLCEKINEECSTNIHPTDIMIYSTINSLYDYLNNKENQSNEMSVSCSVRRRLRGRR